LLRILSRTLRDWKEDEAPRLGASLAYYSVFSLAPLLLISMTIAGMVFGGAQAQSMIGERLADAFGGENAQANAQALLEVAQRLQRPASNALFAALGFVMLLVGASGVVGELKASLNRIWDVHGGPRGWRAYLRKRALALLLVLLGGVLLLAALLLAALSKPAGGAASFAAVTVFVALLYRYLPDTQTRWADIWVGAGVTAALLAVGNAALGLYLSRKAAVSAYGAAASVVFVLLWTYYCAQIFYFGAEFTHVWSERRFSSVRKRSEGKRLSSS
jgi:membrane protein